MNKKIAVINFSGNVGKSTITKYLLLPRLDNATVQSIETINANEFDDEALKGKQFSELLKVMAGAKGFIADIGASNAEDFIEQMFKLRGSHKWFDYFIIPVSPKPKQQQDTISTIKVLSKNKIPKDKIRVVFNMVDDIDEFESTFRPIIDFHSQQNTFTLNTGAIITENEFYLLNKDSGRTLEDIVNDDRDFRKLINETDDHDYKMSLVDESVLKMLADGVKEELDDVYEALFENR